MRPITAAGCAAEAAAELIRYAQEGGADLRPFGELNVVGMLADALRMACEIERAYVVGHPDRREEHDALVALIAATARHTDRWHD